MLFSVIIPVYNKAAYLDRALDCLEAQECTDWEAVLVDDGSTDESLSIARRRESDRIRVFAQDNAGAGAARNTAMANARGDIFAFLDADDLWHPYHLQALAEVFAAFPDTGIASTRWALLEDVAEAHVPTGGEVRQVDYLSLMADTSGYFNSISTAIRRGVYEQLGGMKLYKRGEDVEYWTRIGAQFSAAINTSLTSYYDISQDPKNHRIIGSDFSGLECTRRNYTPVVQTLYDLVADGVPVNQISLERYVDHRISIGLLAAARRREWGRVVQLLRIVDNIPRMVSDRLRRRQAERARRES